MFCKLCFTIVFLILNGISVAQSGGDYVVTLANDTLRGQVDILLSPLEHEKALLRAGNKKTEYYAEDLQAIYSAMVHYEPVIYQGAWIFLAREFSGELTVFRPTSPHPQLDYSFRHKEQTRGMTSELNKRELKNVNSYRCKSVMDSLIAKSDWSTSFRDLAEIYNKRCAASSVK